MPLVLPLYDIHLLYSTAYVQVYQKTCVTLCALRNFENNLCVGLMRHKECVACEQLLTSLKYLQVITILYLRVITNEW